MASKHKYINNNINCEWITLSNQKVEVVRLDKNDNYILHTGDIVQIQDTNTLKAKEWKNIYHSNSNRGRARMAILILEK